MTPLFKMHGTTILWIIIAIAIVATAWFGKDTEYENAFLYVMAIGFVVVAAFELYSKKK